MKTVYDMSTGGIMLTDPPAEIPQRPTSDAPIAELQLQLIAPESRPEKLFPPELVMADLNAFLDTMS
jgi:hypothetical protein